MKINAMKLAALAAPALLAACMVGPDYRRPSVETPAAFKEQGTWKPAEPRDLEARGKWWEAYNDPLLNGLAEQVNISNQTLVRAEAQYRQAIALVQAARAGYFPTLTGGVSRTRSRASATTTATPSVAPISRGVVDNYSLPFQASWEADVWGKVGRAVEANEASAQASAGDLEAARLSAQATLAQNYFQLRVLDATQKLLEDTVGAYAKSQQLVENQYKAGIVARADLVQAQAQLKATEAQVIDVGVQRAQLEHAIAVLIGKPASGFFLVRAPLVVVMPPVPASLPSELLERRPDIAAAERRMQQANAQIGVAKAAYFPSLTLSGAIGYQSATFADWLTAPSRFWSLGTAIAQTIFDGGLRKAQTAGAIAAYDANVASYRLTVLTGFAEVEDNLAALRILEQEAEVQGDATKLSEQSLALALNQYKAGTTNFLTVVVAQTAALANQRASVDLFGRRVTASVQLIKALGGGWSTAELPSRESLIGRNEAPPVGSAPQTGAGK